VRAWPSFINTSWLLLMGLSFRNLAFLSEYAYALSAAGLLRDRIVRFVPSAGSARY
jgi:hypothetical protein